MIGMFQSDIAVPPLSAPRRNRQHVRDEFARTLRRLMIERGLTQAGLARAIDEGRDKVNRYFMGRNLPSPDVMQKLADVLKVEYNRLERFTEMPAQYRPSPVSLRPYARNPNYVQINVAAVVPLTIAGEIMKLVGEHVIADNDDDEFGDEAVN